MPSFIKEMNKKMLSYIAQTSGADRSKVTLLRHV
jgi:hypothetical protein